MQLILSKTINSKTQLIHV